MANLTSKQIITYYYFQSQANVHCQPLQLLNDKNAPVSNGFKNCFSQMGQSVCLMCCRLTFWHPFCLDNPRRTRVMKKNQSKSALFFCSVLQTSLASYCNRAKLSPGASLVQRAKDVLIKPFFSTHWDKSGKDFFFKSETLRWCDPDETVKEMEVAQR